jgi:hypothetical protein
MNKQNIVKLLKYLEKVALRKTYEEDEDDDNVYYELDEAFDFGQADGEIRLARKLLKEFF